MTQYPPPGRREKESAKTCTHCRRALPPVGFPPNRHTSDGLSSWCRECHVQATRRWRAARRAEREGTPPIGEPLSSHPPPAGFSYVRVSSNPDGRETTRCWRAARRAESPKPVQNPAAVGAGAATGHPGIWTALPPRTRSPATFSHGQKKARTLGRKFRAAGRVRLRTPHRFGTTPA